MQTMHLIGAEEVSRAAGRMSDAAHEMQRAASNMDASMENFKRFMDDWLIRFEQANNVYLEVLEQQRQAHSQFGVGA